VTKVKDLQRITFLNNLINQEDFPQSAGPVVGSSGFTGNYRPDQSWDCYGWADNGKLYFGWTTYNGRARRPNNVAVTSDGTPSPNDSRGGASQEDFLIFSYDPATQRVKYIDSFMEASRRQKNLRWHDGSDPSLPHSEETPKGHTRFVNIGDGYLYMASQPFHDFKEYSWRSDDVFPFPLEDFRGGKIYRLDTRTDTLVDLSATMKNTPAPGVTVEHEGIIVLDYMKSTGLLVGLTHPSSDLVFVDPVANAVVRYVTGVLPWTLQGLVVSRDFVIDDINQRIYLSRGNEGGSDDGTGRETMRDVYVYDWNTNTTTKTGSQVFGGMWGTSVVTPDGKAAYVTACGGQLFKIDFTTGKTTHEVFLNPFAESGDLDALYWVIPSPDWTKLYSMPTALDDATQNGLWEYDLLTKRKRMVYTLGSGGTNSNIYTSQKDLLRDGKLYVISAGSQTDPWSWSSSSLDFDTNSANCILFVFDLEFNAEE
jgi:DNA-binding beta-propeller fold protein YncE